MFEYERRVTISIVSSYITTFSFTNMTADLSKLDLKTYLKEVMETKKIPTTNILNQLENFKIFLNPIRMSMMFILIRSHKIKSSELRQLLEISWGNYISHLNALIEAQFVEYKNVINDSTNQQRFVFITQTGIAAFDGFQILFESIFNRTKNQI